MSGLKRKDAPSKAAKDAKKQKKVEVKPPKVSSKRSSKAEDDDNFGGFSEDEETNGGVDRAEDDINESNGNSSKISRASAQLSSLMSSGPKQFKLETSSAEAHAKQRELAKERKANKPNADAIQRSKKIWERLRRKSHVPPAERKELVTELFDIVTGRVRDFVFKHDSVRVIQCALKYANLEQRRLIVQELKGDIRTLAESRYGKFLVAKMVQDRDEQIRDAVTPEFYGHVRRLINHPEASWIVDDIYRQIATPQQKATMLREWYGAEFALFQRKPNVKVPTVATQTETAELSVILEKNPEKRKPILQYLLQMINSLIQKKMTGFTMLHDAMLQYFLALTPSSEKHTEFLEILKGDIDAESEGGGGDLFRNLAFTKSGSRLVSLALAYGTAKDRKIILKCFKDTVETMAYDQYGKLVLVVGLDVPDDTKMSFNAILSHLLGNIEQEAERHDRLEQIVANLNARVPLLYPMAGMAKWLLSEADMTLLKEVHEIRKTTSKKDPEVRRKGLLDYLSRPVLELVTKRAESLVQSSFGCQFITETMLEVNGDAKADAKSVVAQIAADDPLAEGHIAENAAVGRMLKTLVLGGNFDPATKRIKLAEPQVGFAEVLYPVIQDHIVDWACSDSSFVVVALLESEDTPNDVQKNVKAALTKERNKIESAAGGTDETRRGHSGASNGNVNGSKAAGGKGNAGARILLEKIK